AAAGFTGCAGAAGGGALEEQAATAALRNRQNARRRFMSGIADTRQEGNDNRSAAVAARASPDAPARIVAESALVGRRDVVGVVAGAADRAGRVNRAASLIARDAARADCNRAAAAGPRAA